MPERPLEPATRSFFLASSVRHVCVAPSVSSRPRYSPSPLTPPASAWPRVGDRVEAPRTIDVTIVDSKERHAGVGEPGVPVIAPAITAAIFAATGKRIRELPIKRAKLV